MQIEIKKALLEGYAPEEITENYLKEHRKSIPIFLPMVGGLGAGIGGVVDGLYNENPENYINTLPDSKLDGMAIGAGLSMFPAMAGISKISPEMTEKQRYKEKLFAEKNKRFDERKNKQNNNKQ